MIGENPIICRCLEMTQPIGTFYVGVLDSTDLIEIVFSDIRDYKQERLVESISGIQRPLKRARVEELSKYVNMLDASFPTGVILAVNSEDVEFRESDSSMKIRRGKDVAKIIDGQHRIAGLRAFNGQDEGVKFQVNVTIFVDMELEFQALLFSTINIKQTQVENSLVFDLFEYAKSRSPQRTCHNIARVLNGRPGAFQNRIMILGRATGHPSETMTQAAFVKPLLSLISTDPDTDRDLLKRGRNLSYDPALVRTKRLVFRKLFIDKKDTEIASVLLRYFASVAARWPDAWQLRRKGLILNRTTGYRALMRFLPQVIFQLGTDTPTSGQFDEIFRTITLSDDEFTPENFKPGSSGEGTLYHRLLANSGIGENAAWKGREEG